MFRTRCSPYSRVAYITVRSIFMLPNACALAFRCTQEFHAAHVHDALLLYIPGPAEVAVEVEFLF
jgi:hypothetical protein